MRFRTWVIGVFVTVLATIVAIANRHEVVLSFDPFSQDAPALAFSVPLYAALFLLFVLGVLVGGSSTWLGQGRWRKRARQEKRRRTNLERDVSRQPDDGTQIESPEETEALPPPR